MNSFFAKSIIAAFAVMFGVALVATPVGAINIAEESCATNPNSALCKNTKGDNLDNTNVIQNGVNLLLTVLGIIAVVAIIYGGFTYITSNGDSSRTKRAKDIILYSVVGLVVAMMAWGIVSFVLTRFGAS